MRVYACCHARVAVTLPYIKYYLYLYMYIYTLMSVRNFVYSKDLEAVVDNIRWRIVGVMFLPSIFENRCGDFRRSMWRLSKIDVSPFEDRRSMSRCVDHRRSMCRPSEIDVLTFEDRWSMCRPSKIDGRCEIRLLYLLKTLILYISCMRITPRVCTSVLSY